MQDNRPNLLFDPQDVRDNCGVGFVAHIKNVASHSVLEMAFQGLSNLVHRGAIDADGKTGDGAGILTAIPFEFYAKKASEQGVALDTKKPLAVAMIFYPSEAKENAQCREIVRSVLKKYNVSVSWSRPVPIHPEVLGDKARRTLPVIHQKFLAAPEGLSADDFEAKLYLIRKEMEALGIERGFDNFYIASLSTRTIIHKGLFVGDQVREFYQDLKDVDFVSSFALFHQRFSTNTFPTWPLAQPFRFMAHNGEINTIQGNRNWMYAREMAQQARTWTPEDYALQHIIIKGHSDSASFDNVLEAYVRGGRSILHSVVHMSPEAWQNQKNMSENLRAFYEYHACIGEAWDGPAAVAFTDGRIIGAVLDRNGLRPARYQITDEYFVLCSELGCVRLPDADIVENGKLAPGKIIAVDLTKGQILKNDQVKNALASAQPYQDWIEKNLYDVEKNVKKMGLSIYRESPDLTEENSQILQRVFGYTQEDHGMILEPMFKEGKEPVGSMGDDAPLAVFSNRPRLLYTYFKQLFAQVTNPPIDPIREEFVTSLRMYLGCSGNIFEEGPTHAKQLRIMGPIVTKTVFEKITEHPSFKTVVLDALFSVAEGPNVLGDQLEELTLAAERAVVEDGANLIVLSDRNVSASRAPIPMLLAVAAVHHHLIRKGLRLKISLLVETGEAREVHHMACLIGYGASVIYPYLALQVAERFSTSSSIPLEKVIYNYIHAIEAGILKIMSKMGISTLQSYHGAQIFEALGISNHVAHHYFSGTPCRISGSDLQDLATDVLTWHAHAYSHSTQILDVGGHYRFRRDGEYHAFNPDIVRYLHKAVIENDFEAYKSYIKVANERTPMTIRDILKIRRGQSVALSEIEPVGKILPRFNTPGISYGAISKETHETFAIAMNRIGGKSDSGEGGEAETRYQLLPNGDSMSSAIKQVASGRFGVTSYYLSQAKELEIKVAQGAKPGEGGQLPGHKVSEEIAAVRHSTPGVTLISPPPHHDIYSIEDLAQLIYDLKQSNPLAKVCVKLVSEAGVGTIAAGVVKAHADIILISGHDGGTGASPLSSIKHAGLPWELGLAETQQVLVYNKLRGRVILRTDGGLKTGLDVVKAALLGAEEFGFGTSSMIAAGCVMVRQCHMNTCPVGVATQDPKLRAKYKGTPERVINMFHFIAEEVRIILAEMGFRSLDEIIGRSDLLEQVTEVANSKVKRLDLSRMLVRTDFENHSPLRHVEERNDWQDDVPFDLQMIRDAAEILESGSGDLRLKYSVENTHRSVGTQLSYEIVRRYGPQGLPRGRICVDLRGTVGQSFAAFAMSSLELHLSGSANDYVGKGLCGAIVSVRPADGARFKPEENVIVGNTCLYGATSGKLFANGKGGERFAVRNSGASAVVEGVGDHGCEYMTGGKVLILGGVGNNFGAGMTGGVAYIFDVDSTFSQFHNPSETVLQDVDWDTNEAREFLSLLKEHESLTHSPLAKRILGNWEENKKLFKRIYPKELLLRESKAPIAALA